MRFNIVTAATVALIVATALPGTVSAQTTPPPPFPVRPQTPVPPFPYTQVEASYDNSARPGVHLAGTLTVPKGKGPFPAVVLITGSGKQDRDVSFAGHKSFLVLADYLTRRGIAVLRVDDRGVGAGVDWLKTRAEVDRKRIGLIGHSEGAVTAPLVAKANPSVAFAILWAGASVGLRDVVIEQQRAIAAASGIPPATIEANAKANNDLLDILIATQDQASAYAAALKAMLAAGVTEAQAAPAAKLMSTVWYRNLLTYDPQPDLRALKIPALVLIGGKDLLSVASQNIGPYKAALAGNPRARVMELPGLNHMLQTIKTGAPMEARTLTQTMAPEALQVMGDWLAEVTR